MPDNNINENTEEQEAYYQDQFKKRLWVLFRSAVLYIVLIELAKFSNSLGNDMVASFIVNNPAWGGCAILLAVTFLAPFLETKVYGNPAKALSSHVPIFWSYVFKGYYRNLAKQYINEITELTAKINEQKAFHQKEGNKLDPSMTQPLADVASITRGNGLFSSILERPIIIVAALIVFVIFFLTTLEFVQLPSSLPFLAGLMTTYFWTPIVVSFLSKDDKMKGHSVNGFWRHAFHSDIELYLAALLPIKKNRAAILKNLHQIN